MFQNHVASFLPAENSGSLTQCHRDTDTFWPCRAHSLTRRVRRPTIVKEFSAKPNFVPPAKYPQGDATRYLITPEQVPWSVALPGYTPKEHTARFVFGADWADDPKPEKIPGFNAVVDGVNRKTLHSSGTFVVGSNGRPQNPAGRTGMTGRGVLGKWG